MYKTAMQSVRTCDDFLHILMLVKIVWVQSNVTYDIFSAIPFKSIIFYINRFT